MSIIEELGLDPDKFVWQDLALCKGLRPSRTEDGKASDDFYDSYESDPRIAKQIDDLCLHCPVFSQCYRQGKDGEWGVWGAVYWNGAGKPDTNRNSHKTNEVWNAINRRSVE